VSWRADSWETARLYDNRDENLVVIVRFDGSVSRKDLKSGRCHVNMEGKDYAILFGLDVIATVVGIFAYIAIGGSF
jgi:hypothetical protein